MSVHFYEPKKGHGLPHDPMNAIVGPRVIGWIGTRSQQGVLNLAPYSFFNLFNYRPPILGFSSIGYKDSVRNAIETGEDRKSTRLNSSHVAISYAVFCLKKKCA